LLRWHEHGVEIELWLEPGMSQEVIFTPSETTSANRRCER
jgi:hypothetical protein